MLRNRFKILIAMLLLLVTVTSITVIANDPTGTDFDLYFERDYGEDSVDYDLLGHFNYGTSVTIDPGTLDGYVFATYVVNYKVEPYYEESYSFLVTEDLDIISYYKPIGTHVVTFMDANQDQLGYTLFVPNGGAVDVNDIPGTDFLDEVPGYTIDTTTPWLGGDLTNITEDTFFYVNYVEDSIPNHTVTVNNGTGDGTYAFNSVATVTANDMSPANFQYWEKDGEIVSLNPTYTFTVLADTVITAVYSDALASPDSDGLFLNLIKYSGLISGVSTWVGQFNIPENESLIEFGVISSWDYTGGITLDTPNIEIIKSFKFNATTNEFVKHLNVAYDASVVRGYMITTDGNQVTVTYSPIKIEEYATDLYISEYIEGSSNNKAIEIYNGTNNDIDLSNYSIELYSNGNAGPAPSNSVTLSGTLAKGDVYVISDFSAGAEITAVSDITSSVSNFNGDDAIALLNNTTRIDVIGVIGTQAIWSVGLDSTQDHTLIRTSNIDGPNATFTPSEWVAYDIDTFNYLGYHEYETPSSLIINETSPIMVDVNSTTDLSVAYTLNNADPKLIWYSSDDASATVDANGQITTGTDDGFAVITAYSYYDHSINDSITIIVGNYTTYTVTYEENGGSTIPDELNVPSWWYATEPSSVPTKDGYTFAGWFTDDVTFLNAFDFNNDNISGNTTLYAKWTQLPDLFISEYGEPNGGSCKYIETYNPTGASVDLSTYSVNKAVNGGGWGSALALSGTLNAGETIVIAAGDCTLSTDAAQTAGNPAYPTSGITEVIWSGATWNGNDAIGLFKDGVLIDVIGTPDVDPGSSWAVGDGNITDGTTENTILIRVPSVMYGETDWTISAQQWTVIDHRNYSNVGIHTSTSSGPDMTAPVITTSSQRYYSIGDTITLACTASDNVDLTVTCSTSDTVDSQTLGTYSVDYVATDAAGNTSTLTADYIIYPAGDPLTWDLETYYDDAQGLSGLALEAALTIIVNNGFTGVSYDDARYDLDDTDADPDIPGNLILVYLQISRDGTWDAGAIGTWNREHVFPQSLLGVSAGGVNVASDLHNLKPADPQENSSRGNSYFTYDSLGLTDTYEPPDEVKGDIARILFYMTVMYNSGTYDLELVDGIPGLYEMGDLATLLEWNELDPVDAFELARNEAIFGIQGNNNPFIDYPQFVELIWGNHSYYTN